MTETGQNIPPDPSDVFVAGDSAEIVATITVDKGSQTDVTTADIQFVLAREQGREALVTKTKDDGITVSDEATNEITVQVLPEDTDDLGGIGGEDYYYEIEVTDSTGDVATVTTGTWTIHPDTA